MINNDASLSPTPSNFTGSDLPVEQVSWDDVQIFLERLNEQEADNLPRAGPMSCPPKPSGNMPAVQGPPPHIPGGNEINASLANYNSNIGQTASVGSWGEPLGVFDLHGNVWEWCGDLDGPYEVGPLTDPMGSTSGINRVKEVDHGYQSLFPYDLQCVRLEAPQQQEVQLMDSFLPSNYKSSNQPQYCLITEYRGEPTGRLFYRHFYCNGCGFQSNP